MSIVQHKEDPGHRDLKCLLCGDPPRFPYMVWRGDKDFAFCSGCCAAQGEGMMADVVQLTAIRNVRRFYRDFTLERVTIDQLKKADQ
jgi:hypothetical protein